MSPYFFTLEYILRLCFDRLNLNRTTNVLLMVTGLFYLMDDAVNSGIGNGAIHVGGLEYSQTVEVQVNEVIDHLIYR